jgi:pyoverdine/dityrosine biosynthesis protein Dit1
MTQGVVALIEASRKNPEGLRYDTGVLENTVKQIIQSRSPLRLVLPTFHGKCPLRAWTISDLPDQGDFLAARTLVELHGRIADIYPDTQLHLLSEGHLYADMELVGDDHAVSVYLAAVRPLVAECGGVSVIDASDLLGSVSWEERRHVLLDRYCPSVEEVRENLTIEPRWRQLYTAYKKLHEALLSAPRSAGEDSGAALSGRALRRLAKEFAMLQLRKQLGFSRLTADIYKNGAYVKLSALFKTPDETTQVGINLIPGNHQRATPTFFSVCLEADRSYRFIKASRAREGGYALIGNDGLPMFVPPHWGVTVLPGSCSLGVKHDLGERSL